ncbi:hypothetical protein T4D_7472 [Trichinella pseudospiralis]|uniref:Uncharacterized protein n=1 Tax=Trichinella pseudospiralis TaxID=6337 RepID=A0A0V1FYY4_TRIPS|nr:hypothetical protein T4D_7472 [Trichinella pseudospiralis]
MVQMGLTFDLAFLLLLLSALFYWTFMSLSYWGNLDGPTVCVALYRTIINPEDVIKCELVRYLRPHATQPFGATVQICASFISVCFQASFTVTFLALLTSNSCCIKKLSTAFLLDEIHQNSCPVLVSRYTCGWYASRAH